MKTKIVVDSSSNLYALPGVDFACVPLKIVTDEQEYLDDGTLDAVGMARSLRTYKGKTSTSCPNVADWLAAYEGAEQIFVATITGTLSGSYNAALLAAEEYKETHPEARVLPQAHPSALFVGIAGQSGPQWPCEACCCRCGTDAGHPGHRSGQ